MYVNSVNILSPPLFGTSLASPYNQCMACAVFVRDSMVTIQKTTVTFCLGNRLMLNSVYMFTEVLFSPTAKLVNVHRLEHNNYIPLLLVDVAVEHTWFYGDVLYVLSTQSDLTYIEVVTLLISIFDSRPQTDFVCSIFSQLHSPVIFVITLPGVVYLAR